MLEQGSTIWLAFYGLVEALFILQAENRNVSAKKC
jgi:hypothetical protein